MFSQFPIVNKDQTEVACSSCSLRPVCMPFDLSASEVIKGMAARAVAVPSAGG